MASYSLTDRQKSLLRLIVEAVREEKVTEPLLAVCAADGCGIVGMSEDFGHNLLGDVGVLEGQGLLYLRYGGRGTPNITITQAGCEAVDSDFERPDVAALSQISIGAYINEMQGGNIQAVGVADNSEVQQIVNDPEVLAGHIDDLTAQLLDIVKADLSGDRLIAYAKAVGELKDHLTAAQPQPGLLRTVFGALALVGDIEGTVSLVARVWPVLYPLIAIASARLAGA